MGQNSDAGIGRRRRRGLARSFGIAPVAPGLETRTKSDDHLRVVIHSELLQRLCRARDLLRECDDEPRSVHAVARTTGFTRFHFIRLFKAVFGETPHQYRTRAQIEKAKHVLILTDWSVTEVCMAVGFSSLGSFSTLFSRRVGMSPRAFQRRYRPGAGRAAQLPARLIPGCLTLMAKIPGQ